jgi:hypothetical protein
MSMPMSSFVILIKLLPLLNATSLVSIVLPVWICLSVIAFMFVALFNNNIKSKLISLSLVGIASSLHFIYKDPTLLYKLIPYIFSVLFLISISFVIIYNSSSKETDVSYLGGFWRLTKINFLLCLLLLVTSIAVFSRIMLNNYEKGYVILFIMIISMVFHRVFFSKICSNEVVLSGVKNTNIFYILPILVVCGWFLWQTKFWQYQFFYIMSLFAVVSLVFVPVSKIDNIGRHRIWHNYFLNQFYGILFIRPLKLFGRILWLAFDVVVIERSIIASVSHFSQTVVLGMHKIQENNKYNYLYGIFLGILIIGIYFIKGIYK